MATATIYIQIKNRASCRGLLLLLYEILKYDIAAYISLCFLREREEYNISRIIN
jgi:hypothetical protein